ncbi:DUF2254 domain-containing protein [Aurantimonas aggregata]|uniref:DUF2254 domain-containing protein n=1 Tax=Aurantimonas aggregata TaxID=2047720 RepID=A0A6L9MH96_9HYPH|nr:DUF2254 domain-containing protein [Aurantimonas aggregata]NDV87204.1 DUF2254 domain-containing protein [Aurantimonas aggregata]
MRAFVQQYYQRVIASYWFIPSIMATAAAVLAIVLVEVDARVIQIDSLGDSVFLFATQPDGARAILSAIGGSMIGVAGTVFSVTMAAVVFASGSFGPRLLTNFMNDRGNQVTLGVFVATFVYCMLVLRSVQDGADSGPFGAMFVPNIAVFAAIILAIASIGVLIFFIHHVPSNIHISNVIAGIGSTLTKQIEATFRDPQEAADDPGTREDRLWQIPACFHEGVDEMAASVPYAEVACDRAGYLQVVDRQTLVNAARDADIVVRLNCRTGEFVHPGRVLFHAWPSERVSEETRQKLLSSIATGNERTPSDDLMFLFDELVEIAARALSPGVNDPFTAITCLDWLMAAMATLAGHDGPDPLHDDGEGRLRVIDRSHSFGDYLEMSFGHVRQYAASDMIAGERFLLCLAELVPACRTDAQREAIRFQMESFMAQARPAHSGAALATIDSAGEWLGASLRHPRGRLPPPGPAVQPVAETPADR